jgi:hypothetical protein
MDGNVHGAPTIMKEDLERAYQIDPSLHSVQKTLKVYADVMHIGGKKFLVSVSDPLNLTLQSKIDNESHTTLGLALQGQLALLRSQEFVPMIVYTDPHSTFRSMTQDFLGVEIDIGGAGNYVAQV